ncbi:MAG: helix-turn-helix transcriptional regulator, partial [Nitrospirota bacterium]|nr:helix-turn-helix transcriptional regulator [Nitrospirota bacterium]
MKENKIEFEESSGNVFEDLGFPNPEMEQLKSALSFEIFTILKKRKLTQAQAAKVLDIDQPQVSRLKNADFTRFSVERLFGFLNRLGRDVDIHINRAKDKIPRQRVVHADGY